MCLRCAKQSPEESKENFIATITELGGKVIGKYVTSSNNTECECPKGHTCYPTPNAIQQGKPMCRECFLSETESRGEKLVSGILSELGIEYEREKKHPGLNRLRFDFRFEYNDKVFYIEYDGIQHQGYTPHFHDSEEHFKVTRERDLAKNYCINKSDNCVLIRLDHSWGVVVGAVKRKELNTKLTTYIKECLENSSQRIIADHVDYR